MVGRICRVHGPGAVDGIKQGTLQLTQGLEEPGLCTLWAGGVDLGALVSNSQASRGKSEVHSSLGVRSQGLSWAFQGGEVCPTPCMVGVAGLVAVIPPQDTHPVLKG